MHSIAHFIIENNENSKVLYVTSEEFTNELIETIRNGNNTAMSKFREKYRNIDNLAVFIIFNNKVGNGMHKMGLSQSGASKMCIRDSL